MQIITESDFRKKVKGGGLSGGFLFFGSEDYLKGFALKAAREAICPDEALAPFNNLRLDGLDLTPDSLLGAITTLPMMSDRKLIEITSFDFKAMRPDELDEYCQVFAMLGEYDYNMLILIASASQIESLQSPKKLPPILKRFSEVLTPVSFDLSTPLMLSRWAEKHFLANGVRADSAVCASLVDFCGSDMYRLAGEIDKISWYVLADGRESVEPSDVTRVAIADTSYEAYALANAIMANKKNEALEVLGEMKRRRIDPLIILGEIVASFCDMLSVKLLAADGLMSANIASSLKIHEFKVKICLRTPADLGRLRRAVRLCTETDCALKLSSGPEYDVLEKLICSL